MMRAENIPMRKTFCRCGKWFLQRRRHKKSRSWHSIEVVAVAGKHGEAWALHAHFDAVIRLRAIGLRRRVGERVLIARLLGDARIEPFNIIPPRAVEKVSALS